MKAIAGRRLRKIVAGCCCVSSKEEEEGHTVVPVATVSTPKALCWFHNAHAELCSSCSMVSSIDMFPYIGRFSSEAVITGRGSHFQKHLCFSLSLSVSSSETSRYMF